MPRAAPWVLPRSSCFYRLPAAPPIFSASGSRIWNFRNRRAWRSPRLSLRASSAPRNLDATSLLSPRPCRRTGSGRAAVLKSSVAAWRTRRSRRRPRRDRASPSAFGNGVVAPALAGARRASGRRFLQSGQHRRQHGGPPHATTCRFRLRRGETRRFCQFLSRAVVCLSRRYRGLVRPKSFGPGRVAHDPARRARTPFPQCRLARGGIRGRARLAARRPARLWRSQD